MPWACTHIQAVAAASLSGSTVKHEMVLGIARLGILEDDGGQGDLGESSYGAV